MIDLFRQLPLFVYGTLLPGERNYARHLAGRTVAETPATVHGEPWWIETEDYPYLCRGDAAVHGCLVAIDEDCYSATLRAIDRLEDFYPDNPRASLYLRKPFEVVTRLGTRQAWTYFWVGQQRPGVRLSSGDFACRKQTSEG